MSDQEEWELYVWEEDVPVRMDQAVSALTQLSRAKAAALIKAGKVLRAYKWQVQDRSQATPALKSDTLLPTQAIWVNLEEPKPLLEFTPHPLEILYEDDDVVAVNKPVGMAAHASVGWQGPTVLGALLAAGKSINTSGDEHRMGIVSRLDVGTTGVMIVAKTERAYKQLQAQFKERVPVKVYHAIVQGCPRDELGTIDAPIGRHVNQKAKMSVREDGREAITHYHVLEQLKGASLVEIKLETGRTHQIRVHMQAIGHPVIGDPMYGADLQISRSLGLDRQWLHARMLRLPHPVSGEELEIIAPYPRDLDLALERLREI